MGGLRDLHESEIAPNLVILNLKFLSQLGISLNLEFLRPGVSSTWSFSSCLGVSLGLETYGDPSPLQEFDQRIGLDFSIPEVAGQLSPACSLASDLGIGPDS